MLTSFIQNKVIQHGLCFFAQCPIETIHLRGFIRIWALWGKGLCFAINNPGKAAVQKAWLPGGDLVWVHLWDGCQEAEVPLIGLPPSLTQLLMFGWLSGYLFFIKPLCLSCAKVLSGFVNSGSVYILLCPVLSFCRYLFVLLFVVDH